MTDMILGHWLFVWATMTKEIKTYHQGRLIIANGITLTIVDNDSICLSCQHTYYDHEGRFTDEERQRINKHRQIGCRCCRCPGFQSTTTVYRVDESFWEE